MTGRTRSSRETAGFFGLVLLLSVPFWVMGAVSDATVTAALSVASLMIVAPFLAAVLFTWRGGGGRSVRALLARAVDPRFTRGARWFLPVLLLMPAAVLVEVGLLRFSGHEVPAFEVTPLVLVADLALFWVAATLEEVGWTGYATDRLLVIRGRLGVALVIGVMWALWHVPAMLAMPGEPSWTWIALQCLNLVIVRVLIVWVYVGAGGSLFAAIGLHALLNLSTLTLFPVYGSHYDPLVANIVLGVVAVLIIRSWGTSMRGSITRAVDRLRATLGPHRSRTSGRRGAYVGLGLAFGPALGYAVGRALGDPDVALLTAGLGTTIGLILGSALAKHASPGSASAR
jgi:membrane protease YdiL (CAAX protease family)